MPDTTTHINSKPEAQAVAEIVTKHLEPKLVDVMHGEGSAGSGPHGSDEVPVLVLPSGLQAHSVKKFVDEYRSAPERREGKAHLVELASFVAHVNRFKDEDSALFASPNPDHPMLTGVFDYHRRGSEGAPRFGTHRAIYPFPLSDEWKAWIASNKKPMAQAEFAGWLEDRIVDVADPTEPFATAKRFADALGIAAFAAPGKLLQLSRGLTVHVDERATTKLDPSTGETTVFYQAEHQDETGAPLAVPRAFLIRIPVFREGEHFQLAVRLKYALSGGRLSWRYELHDVSLYFDAAFRAAAEHAAEATELPIFYGSPES